VHSQQISLRKRIFNFKDLREVVNCSRSTFESKASLLFETPSGIDPDRDALALVLALCHGLDVFKITYCPSEELQARMLR